MVRFVGTIADRTCHKTCKRDVRLELQGDEHATARAMYAKVRHHIQRHL